MFGKTVTDPVNQRWEFAVIGKDDNGNLKINHRAKKPEAGMLGGGGTVTTMSREDWQAFKEAVKNAKLAPPKSDTFAKQESESVLPEMPAKPLKLSSPSLSSSIDETKHPVLHGIVKASDKFNNDMMFIATTGIHPAIAPQFLKDAHPFYREVT